MGHDAAGHQDTIARLEEDIAKMKVRSFTVYSPKQAAGHIYSLSL